MTAMPRRVRTGHDEWPLHAAAASRAAEAAAAPGLPPHALMQRAGTSLARLAAALAPHAGRIDVLAGPGNNGGDGWVAAMLLHRSGRAVRVLCSADPARLPDDAAWARHEALAAGVPHDGLPAAARGAAPGLWIDALLGLGAARAPAGQIADAIAWLNRATAPVLAVDLPSGLHPDTGQAAGAVVRATHTLALLTLKPGLFTGVGRDLAGEVWFDDLGAAAPEAQAVAKLPSLPELRAAWPPRTHASHKGSYGDVLVVGGAPGMGGAATLAAEAAAAAGAGRVYVSALDPQAAAPRRPELMTRSQAWLADPAWLAVSTVCAGCGGGSAIGKALPALLTHAGRLVLDADALNAIASDRSLQAALRDRARRGQASVLTPHPLEAARLLAATAAQVQADRLQAARQLAELTGSVVLLKGSGTLVAAPGTAMTLNPTGNALLASPGSGDVLAGWIAGTWSALADAGLETARRAAEASAWLHGHAADRAEATGQRLPLRAGDLPDAMARALGADFDRSAFLARTR